MEEQNSLGLILLNRYQLLRQIGRGGMALVFEARDLMLERTVAVKLLKSDFRGMKIFKTDSGRKPGRQQIFPTLEL